MRSLLLSIGLIAAIGMQQSVRAAEDITLMFDTLNKLTLHFMERAQQLQPHEQLVATDTDDFNEMVTWYGTFLVTMFRLFQHTYCLAEKDMHLEQWAAIWNGSLPMFTILSDDVQEVALEQALGWITRHADDAWEPFAHEDTKDFIDADAWREARELATIDYIIILQNIGRQHQLAIA